MDLDALEEYSTVDPANALADVEATAEQWREAAQLGPGRLDIDAFDAVVLSGMGGSGIAGDVAWALSLHGYPRPIVVHKGYGAPGFTGPRTLVVCFSHSGSTEETLSAFEAAGRKGAARLVITSGGQLAEDASAAGVDIALMPGGSQPPRHSLGFLLVPALIALGLDEGLEEAIEVLTELREKLGRHVPSEQNPAKLIAERIAAGVVPLAWGGHGIGSVAAYRLKCQLNENAKIPALHAEIPEAGHNDVVGWEQPSALTGVGAMLSLRDTAGEHPRVARRFEIAQDFLGGYVAWIHRIDAQGAGPLARMASLLLQADLVSVYTALAADRNPTPIQSIDRIKAELGTAASVR